MLYCGTVLKKGRAGSDLSGKYRSASENKKKRVRSFEKNVDPELVMRVRFFSSPDLGHPLLRKDRIRIRLSLHINLQGIFLMNKQLVVGSGSSPLHCPEPFECAIFKCFNYTRKKLLICRIIYFSSLLSIFGS